MILTINSESWLESFLTAAVFLILAEIAGLYRKAITLSALNDLPRLAATCFIALFFAAAVFEFHGELGASLQSSASTIAALFALRICYFAIRRHRRRRSVSTRSRTAIVGGGVVAAKLLESIAEFPSLGLEPVVVIDSDPLFDQQRFDVPVVTDVAIRDLVEQEDIQTVIVAFRHSPDSSLVSPLRECDRLDCEIFIVPRLFEFVHLSADMDRIHTIPLIRVRRSSNRTWHWHFKRLFDIVVSFISLVVFAPVLAVTAAVVYGVDRRAPIIFRQVRVGRDGNEITLYKFRSMRPVPESTSNTDWNPDRADRVGRVGRFIRKTSIDELPQLWNVLRGDMSIVGPRPERPHFVEQFKDSIPSYRDRHRVDAGLTGWAAIHGLRGDTSIDDRALYDNFYIENWSVWLDIKIIILTIRAVFRGTGS